jgi:hypothetical protein
MKRSTLIAAVLALVLAGCGNGTGASTTTTTKAKTPTTLQGCLKAHGKVTQISQREFNYNAVDVTSYPSAQQAKASIYPGPTLEFEIQDGRYVIRHGDAISTDVQDTRDVQTCLRRGQP